MENKFTHHITVFNDRVRAMNQMNKTELRLTSVEANNLLSDVFAVLAEATRLQAEISGSQDRVVEVVMDGGGFK
jgi:hypothetical protein